MMKLFVLHFKANEKVSWYLLKEMLPFLKIDSHNNHISYMYKILNSEMVANLGKNFFSKWFCPYLLRVVLEPWIILYKFRHVWVLQMGAVRSYRLLTPTSQRRRPPWISSLTPWRQNPQVHHSIYNRPPPVPTQSQLNPIYTPPSKSL
jgi:hypothetical protein